MINAKIKKAAANLHLTKIAATHLFGERHTQIHRIGFGTIFILIGVAVAENNLLVYHFISSGVGYLLHGIGGMPIGEYLLSNKNKI